MMTNVKYEIREIVSSQENTNLENLISEFSSSNFEKKEYVNCQDENFAVIMDYSLNYTVKRLSTILDYYKISSRNMKKNDMVFQIVLYENDPINWEIVERRKQLWNYFIELKEDNFFSKYLVSCSDV